MANTTPKKVEEASSSGIQNLNVKRGNGQKGFIQQAVLDSEEIIFTWSNINVSVLARSRSKMGICRRICKKGGSMPRGKEILKNDGVARPGELLAILGASGAGKTTLLNTLTFRNSSQLMVSGIISANGTPVNANSLTNQMAYVEQEDLFIATLTVREHLIFQALLRMDKHISYKQRMQRVEEVLQELGLSNCQNTIIGIRGRVKGISCGEMKRLSFAAEVLTNPFLMFCDEPTSGLDSFMASNAIQVLKRLAKTGKTIVCTIHQPSSELYAMFDSLLLMAEGRVAFLGTPIAANTFFSSIDAPCPSNYNPADYFIQLLAIIPGKEESCKQAVNTICDQFQKSKFGIKNSAEATSSKNVDYRSSDYLPKPRNRKTRYKASFVAQFRAVLWRSWISVIKEPSIIKINVIQTVVAGLIVGAVFYGQKLDNVGVMNINGALFTFVTSMTFQNSFAVIHVFCDELPIFIREHKNGMYRTDIYFLCKTLAEVPVYIFIPTVFVCICYYLIGLNPEPSRFFFAIVITVLVTNVAVSYGYFVSCISSSISMALALEPTLVFPFLLFGGYFLNVESIPVYFKWISYASWFRHGNEALMINQWEGIENINCTSGASLTCPRNGHIVLKMFNFSEDNFTMDLIALCCLICGFRLLAYLGLVQKTCTLD